MFESSFSLGVTEWAINNEALQTNYAKCWEKIPDKFHSIA